MDGASRTAVATGRQQLETLLRQVHPGALADELVFVGSTLDSSAGLRRALTDQNQPPEAKQQLVQSLFSGKTSEQTRHLMGILVSQRWSTERDLADTLDLFAAESVLALAEREHQLERTEQELFAFARTVQGTPELREALADRRRSGSDKAALVEGLLRGKATEPTVRLAALAAANPRGQRVDQALQRYIDVASRRREQVSAVVTAAAPLNQEHTDRLTRALSSMYGKPVQVNVVLDPEVLGGLRVQIGDEVIDGTIMRRLDDARRAMAG